MLRINNGEEKNPIGNQGLSNVRLIERQDSADSLHRSQIHQPLNIFKSVSLAGFDKAVIEVLKHKTLNGIPMNQTSERPILVLNQKGTVAPWRIGLVL